MCIFLEKQWPFWQKNGDENLRQPPSGPRHIWKICGNTGSWLDREELGQMFFNLNVLVCCSRNGDLLGSLFAYIYICIYVTYMYTGCFGDLGDHF